MPAPPVTPTPTPAPTPTPTPTPTSTPAANYAPMAIFSGLSQNTSFATRGYDNRTTPAVNVPYDGSFVISYDATSNSYSISSNVFSGRFDENVGTSDANFLRGDVRSPTPNPTANVASLTVLKPITNGSIALTYSSLAIMRDANTLALIYVAFGFPTPAASVPITGSASYAAKAFGRSAEETYAVGGDVQLNFNFGAGTLSGYFDPTITGGFPLDVSAAPLGRYTFANTVYSSGSNVFSGSFVLPPGVAPGISAFDGTFTGPSAQELIARFQAPFLVPLGGTSRMYGVWVGAR